MSVYLVMMIVLDTTSQGSVTDWPGGRVRLKERLSISGMNSSSAS